MEKEPRRLIKYHSRREADRFYAYDVATDSPFEDDDDKQLAVEKLALDERAKDWNDREYRIRGPGHYCIHCDSTFLEWDTFNGVAVEKAEGFNKAIGQSCFDCAEKIKFGVTIQRQKR